MKRFAGIISIFSFCILAFSACQDEVSSIGESIFRGDVQINVDSTSVVLENANTVNAREIDSRSITNLLGNIHVPEYGELSASYVTQLLASSELSIPDSITVDRVDSLKLLLTAPRKLIIGDTLAPQQLQVFELTQPLPNDIKSNFPINGKYDPSSPIATRNYTLSGLALSDSAFQKLTNLTISAKLPQNSGKELFNAYKNNPDLFAWPKTFNEKFRGFYIKPSFGKGAIANILSTRVLLYYHYFITRNVVENDVSVRKTVRMKDSVCLLANAPEVLSSTIFDYTPSQQLLQNISDGKKIVTAPLGYHVSFKFPVRKILEEFWASTDNLKIINNLTLTLPASPISNDYGINPPPDLLMVLTKDIEDFFANGKVPDNITSFRGKYSSERGRYEFASMREFIVNLKDNESKLTDEDVTFTLIPVEINSESVNNYNGGSTVYITSCTPYLQRPAMAEIHTDKALVVFTYTSQVIK